MVNVYYQKKIAAKPQALRDILLDHHNLSDFFNASFSVLRQENTNEISGGERLRSRSINTRRSV